MNNTSLTTPCRHRLRIASIVLMVVGVLLLSWGAVSTDSFGSIFSGSAPAKSLWILGTGLIVLVAGAFGAFHYRKD